MGLTPAGFWYPDPATPLSLQGMFSAAASASSTVAKAQSILSGAGNAANAAALTALFTSTNDPYTGAALAPVLGSRGSINGVPMHYNGTAWVNAWTELQNIPWIYPALSGSWGIPAGGVRAFGYRKRMGQVEFCGILYGGNMTLAANGGSQLTGAISDLAGTVSTPSGSYMRLVIGVVAGAKVMTALLNVLASGVLYVNAIDGEPITNGVYTFEGLSYADANYG